MRFLLLSPFACLLTAAIAVTAANILAAAAATLEQPPFADVGVAAVASSVSYILVITAAAGLVAYALTKRSKGNPVSPVWHE